MSQYCGNWAWLTPDGDIRPWLCMRPNCAKERTECYQGFARKRAALLDALVVEYGLWRFFTLTVDPKMVPENTDVWGWISNPWSKMRKRLKRVCPGFRFVAVLEKHKKNNRPHIHGFTDSWIDQALWARAWEAAGGGKVVWVEKVKESDRASKYVTKYLGKDQISGGYIEARRAKSRTMWRSKGLRASIELQREEGWCIIKERVFDDQGQIVTPGRSYWHE